MQNKLPTKFVACSIATMCVSGNVVMSQTAVNKPNVVVFLVDDMGVMDTQVPFLLNESGNPVKYPLNNWYRTPNMEQLANQGTRFSTFYAQSVSSPSRASLITGQNSTRHHTTTWINPTINNKGKYGPRNWNWDGIMKNSITLPLLLKQNGYKTIHIGKAHFGHAGSDGEDPRNIGFDINIGGSAIGHPGSYYGENGYGNIKGDKKQAVMGLEKYHGTDTFLTEALTLEANLQIEEAVKENKPFFLYMSHYAVHAPFEYDKRFIENYSNSDKAEEAKAYATLIEGMDKSLGDIISKLNELGVAENTLILFLGDNGSDAPLGDEKSHYSSAPLRGKKGTEYEGGTRVPFIAAWSKPNRDNRLQAEYPIRQGFIQKQPGSIIDIYPTILSLTGINNPTEHTIDGFDLKKELAGDTNKNSTESFLMHFPHEHRGSYFTTFIDKNWKLIYRYNPETPKNPTHELYDLKTDPYENTNLASTEKKILKSMIEKMARQLEKENAQYPEDLEGNQIKPFY